jgi:hypothetical protein
MPPERAARQLREYLKFLLLLGATQEEFAPSKEGDIAWHAHILHTQDYAEWCQRHFGHFVHHVPDEPDEQEPSEDFLERKSRLAALFFGEKSIYANH